MTEFVDHNLNKPARIVFVEMMGVPGSTLLGRSSKVPVAALDFGNHCYSTQFHPEGTEQTLGTIWRLKAPELMARYHPRDQGDRLVENFLVLARVLATGKG